MGQEIERKFLVSSDAWRAGAKAHIIQQGYLAREPHRTVRVRLMDGQAWMTVKGPTTGISREEVEFAIDAEVAEQLFPMCLDAAIHKTRHKIFYGGMLWEVDEFHHSNEGLVIAEIELLHEDADFERPAWLGPETCSPSSSYRSGLSKQRICDLCHGLGVSLTSGLER
jgi:adenylate cyclase